MLMLEKLNFLCVKQYGCKLSVFTFIAVLRDLTVSVSWTVMIPADSLHSIFCTVVIPGPDNCCWHTQAHGGTTVAPSCAGPSGVWWHCARHWPPHSPGCSSTAHTCQESYPCSFGAVSFVCFLLFFLQCIFFNLDIYRKSYCFFCNIYFLFWIYIGNHFSICICILHSCLCGRPNYL